MLCSIVRWQLSSSLDHEASWLARRHVSRCAACRAYRVRLEALHGALSSSAIAAPLPVVRAPRFLGRASWALGGAVALATCVIAVLALRSGSPAAIDPVTVRSDDPSGAPVVRRSQRVLGAASGWLDAAPLHNELAALEADLRRGAAIALRIPRPR